MAITVVVLLNLLLVMPIFLRMVQVSHTSANQELHATVQAGSVARAGVTEAILWFRRQPGQPVAVAPANGDYPYPSASYPTPDAAFFPLNTTDPATTDTIDQAVGLVKEYPLDKNIGLWARYVVRRQSLDYSSTADPVYDSHAVHDVSDQRLPGTPRGSGLVWSIESEGIIYRRKTANLSVPFDQAPNEVVSHAHLRTEIRRLGLDLPKNNIGSTVKSAVYVNDRHSASFTSGATIEGGAQQGFAYYSGHSGPTVDSAGGASVSSIYHFPAGGATALDAASVFKATPNELKFLSDYNVTSVNSLPTTYPAMAIVFIDGSAHFDATHPLRGGGILFVRGNLIIDAGSDTLFNGLIYVTGNTTITGPAIITGTLLVEGSLDISGGGASAHVQYSDVVLDSVRLQLGHYRESVLSTYGPGA